MMSVSIMFFIVVKRARFKLLNFKVYLTYKNVKLLILCGIDDANGFLYELDIHAISTLMQRLYTDIQTCHRNGEPSPTDGRNDRNRGYGCIFIMKISII